MEILLSTKQAYTEIDNFIELLDEYNKNKIPIKLREYFKKEKDLAYVKQINPNKPFIEQNLKEETLALIALLNLKYLCEDEDEKERLEKIYEQNEEKYQIQLKEKNNSNNLFKDRTEQIKNKQSTENDIIIYHKETFFEKLKKYMMSIFKSKNN